MKERNAFTLENTQITEEQRSRANALFDRWCVENPFHGADSKGWQVRSETMKSIIIRRVTESGAELPSGEELRAMEQGVPGVHDSINPLRIPQGAEPYERIEDAHLAHLAPDMLGVPDGKVEAWPPPEGVTGPDEVDPLTLEPMTDAPDRVD